MINSSPIPITDALRSVAARRVLALSPQIGTADIAQHIPAAVRNRAFFSARTPYAGYLADTQSMIERLVQPDVRLTADGAIETAPGESISPAQVRARMKQHLAEIGYQPDPVQRGTLTDLSSDRRTNLIIETQSAMARGYGNWMSEQNPTIRDLWPASELFRALDRQERRDWAAIWNDARRSLGPATTATVAANPDSGPFIALKNDPIWSAISRFGNPYPPFDFGSGMRTRDVSRDAAIAAGVIAPDEPPPDPVPLADPLGEPVEMEMASVPAPLRDALVRALGAIAVRTATGMIINPAAAGAR